MNRLPSEEVDSENYSGDFWIVFRISDFLMLICFDNVLLYKNLANILFSSKSYFIL